MKKTPIGENQNDIIVRERIRLRAGARISDSPYAGNDPIKATRTSEIAEYRRIAIADERGLG